MAATSPFRERPHRPARWGDILQWPLLGRLLRWRWARLVFQGGLLLVAALIIYDGLTGPQLAPNNIATLLAWVHYRGLVILALLLAGNLFCMSCPFALLRTIAPRISSRGRRWPRALRNKWPAIGLLFVFFWAYEWLDLWASPWLTAWIAVAYFVAAFGLEAIFSESAFCKYVCPLGTFNFVQSTASPLQVQARDADRCRTCPGHECVNGSSQGLGCGTKLFVPQIRSNMDCTLCLDCARVCPYDNVALAVRRPAQELVEGAWPQRWDLAFLVMMLTFTGLSNALGMVPPVYGLEAWLAGLLHTRSEAVVLLVIFGTTNLLLPAGLGLGAAWSSRRLAGAAQTESLRAVFSRHAPVLVPLGFAIWLAHYGFHFATGALGIIPVFQSFLLDHGLVLGNGSPNWEMGALLPSSWLSLLQTAIVGGGFVASLYVLQTIESRASTESRVVRRAALPWLALLLALAFAAIILFHLPMEMRGTPSLY
jgi:polyferredoxin